MRVVIAMMKHETNTFSPVPTPLARFGKGGDKPYYGRDAYDAIWMKSAIARLKPVYRETAILVAGEQLTHKEAADILGVAEATISWRMHEVRRLLAATGSEEADIP